VWGMVVEQVASRATIKALGLLVDAIVIDFLAEVYWAYQECKEERRKQWRRPISK